MAALKNSPTKSVRHILVPVDFSPGSSAAVDYAHFLADSFGAAITLLHACEVPSPMSAIVPGTDVARDLQEERARAEALLAGMVEMLEQRGLRRTSTLMPDGSPIETILRVARDGGFDLIVIGTHGRAGFSRLVLGSVAEEVLRKACCPVVMVHAPPSERT